MLKNWGENLPAALQARLEKFEESFGLEAATLCEGKAKFTLILGSDFYAHENANFTCRSCWSDRKSYAVSCNANTTSHKLAWRG
ncbi:hypothetical protein VBZ67_02515 [Campylobacter concisus]